MSRAKQGAIAQPNGTAPMTAIGATMDPVACEETLRMEPSTALQRHRDTIRQIVEHHRAKNARVIGSVLHGQDSDESDLDIVVDPTEDTSLFDIGAIRAELTDLLEVEVNVVTPSALPDRWRRDVLNEAETI